MSEISKLNPHGFFEVTNLDGETTRGETLQCCHCGGHWQLVKGSGRVRGFCTRCNQVTCGSESCMQCLHWEAKLEVIEGTRNPTAVSVPVGGSVSAGGIWCPGSAPQEG